MPFPRERGFGADVTDAGTIESPGGGADLRDA